MKNRVLVEIQALTDSGSGVGVVEGREIHVPFVLPGELVDVQLEAHSQHRNVSFGRALGIQKRSVDRTEPFCPHVTQCGGCPLQHISNSGQLRAKEELVRKVLSKQAILSKISINSCLQSPNQEGYRSIAKWVVSRQRGQVILGSYARRSHDVVSMEGCRIHREGLERLGQQLRVILQKYQNLVIGPHGLRYLVARESLTSKERGLVLVHGGELAREHALVDEIVSTCRVQSLVAHENTSTGDDIFSRNGRDRLLAGTWGITELFGGATVRLPLRSFLQINREQSQQLYDYIESIVYSGPCATVVDLYGGAGELSLRLSKQVTKLWLVERVESAIEAAKQALVQLQRDNVACLSMDAQEGLAKIGAADVVCVNPPRGGMDAKTMAALQGCQPTRIVYTSCSPQNFARDAALLCENGYMLVSVQPFDLFPQTPHVEIVALLQREV